MRDDKKLVVGDPPKEYDYKKFSDILNRIEVFANSIMAAGPARLSAIDTTGMPTSGTGLRDNAVYNHNGVLVVQPATGVDADTLGGHDPSYYGAALGYTPVNKAGDTMTGGLAFGSTVASSPNNLTRHLALWGINNYGFCVTDSTLNYNSDNKHDFYSASSFVARISGSGIQVGSPTGGDPGAGKINAVDYQINGTSISSLYVAATDYTAADVLTKIKTVDGSGSGLDADTLDGHDTAYFQTALGYTPANVAGDTFMGAVTFSGTVTFDSTSSFVGAVTFGGNSTSFSGPGSGNVGIELGGHGYTNFAFIDFHTGATDVDFDVRLIASGGSGVAGGGTLAFTGAHLGWNTAPTLGSDLANKDYVDSIATTPDYGAGNAALAQGAVGTYTLAQKITSGGLSRNGTLAAASLRYVTFSSIASTSTLTGTWRLMSHDVSGGSTTFTAAACGLWLRIS